MPIIHGTHRATQEREYRGYQWLWSTPPANHAVAPVPPVGSYFVRQEQPWHPTSNFWAGKQGPNVRPPVADTVIVRQEYPDHPRNNLELEPFGAGVQGPNVRPPVANTIIVRQDGQERPWHPVSFLWSAPPPVPKQIPFKPALLVRQEQPWHPGSNLYFGHTPIVYEDRQVFLILPGPKPFVGFAPEPNVRAPVTDAVLLRQDGQERPWHPTSNLWAGVRPTNPPVTAVPPVGSFLGRQEQPPHPLPNFWAGKQGPNVAAPPQVKSDIIVRQEQPWHPTSVLRRHEASPPPLLEPPVTRSIVLQQEQPYHPRSNAGAGVQGPSVAAPPQITDRALVTQEQPYHPGSQLWYGVQPTPLFEPQVTRSILMAQEMPGHPRSQFFPGTPPVISATGNSLIFNSASTQYLTKTGNASANQQKFTIASWFRRASIDSVMGLYGGEQSGGSNVFEIDFSSTNTINIIGKTSGTLVLNKITSSTYPDTSGWHHLLLGVDTTQAIAADRVRLYIDGTEVTSWVTNTIPSQNQNLATNVSSAPTPYSIGSDEANSNYFNGKLAQFYYIDGQQLDPTSFMSAGAPIAYTGTYTGVFDLFLPFSNDLSTTTLGQDASGEGNNWTLHNMTTANQSSDYP